jgi:prevent-host-death family protein
MREGLGEQPVRFREVGVRELSRRTDAVLGAALAGERVIVTRYGEPVAVILGTDQAAEWLLASAEEFARMWLQAHRELGV